MGLGVVVTTPRALCPLGPSTRVAKLRLSQVSFGYFHAASSSPQKPSNSGPVVMRSGGVEDLPLSRWVALVSSLLAFTLVFVYFVMRRVALERLQGRVEAARASQEG